MKDLIIAVILAAILICYCSYIDVIPIEIGHRDNFGTQYKGESDLIIPGSGDALTEIIPKTESTEASTEVTEPAEVAKVTEVPWEIHNDILKEGDNMDGMLIAFWHGVAAVLIGEVSAVAVAFVWNKWFKEEK